MTKRKNRRSVVGQHADGGGGSSAQRQHSFSRKRVHDPKKRENGKNVGKNYRHIYIHHRAISDNASQVLSIYTIVHHAGAVTSYAA